VDANARKGFMQTALTGPGGATCLLASGLEGRPDGEPAAADRRPPPSVVSFTIDQAYGWATAGTAAKGLMIGYLWKTEDYPWSASGAACGTASPWPAAWNSAPTGLHQPFPVLVEKGHIFGRRVVMYLDADRR